MMRSRPMMLALLGALALPAAAQADSDPLSRLLYGLVLGQGEYRDPQPHYHDRRRWGDDDQPRRWARGGDDDDDDRRGRRRWRGGDDDDDDDDDD